MKKRYIILITGLLALYTAAMVIYYVLSAPVTKSKNNASMRSYIHVVLSETEKDALFDRLGVDVAELAAPGFPLAAMTFLAPDDYPKEVHSVKLAFENIYCQAEILFHEDEVRWERERLNGGYSEVGLFGMPFAYSPSSTPKGGFLKFDDTVNNIIYIFYCSESLESALYREFLQAFFIWAV